VEHSKTCSLLEGFFGKENVVEEWDIAKESEDALQKGLQYCPRIDFAIKPFNIDRNVRENRHSIAEAYDRYHGFFQSLREIGQSNSDWDVNRNPRCFLAIEYENKTTTKHRLGSLINACAIGDIARAETLQKKR
jgi:hypothetical protein